MRFRALPVLPLLLTTLPTTAQEEPAAGFEALIEVTEVLLDVLALDRSGRVVIGLGKDDFIVEENGEPVDVTGVTFYTTRYLSEGEVPSSRYFIFFFHDQIRDGYVRRQLEAARQAQHWVEDHMLPSDWVAVASYDFKLKLQQDFTQDRHAILEGIDNANRRRDPEKGLGRRGRPLPPSGAPSLLRHLPYGKELRKKTTRMYSALRLVAEASGYIVGRKNLLLFSNGFGRLTSIGGLSESDPRYYPQMKRALNDTNVAVYPIELIEGEHTQSHFLNILASDTGGYYYRNFINFIAPLRQIGQENVGYYLLSYQSEHPADEVGYQEVRVKPRDRKIKLRARKGYRYGLLEEG